MRKGASVDILHQMGEFFVFGNF